MKWLALTFGHETFASPRFRIHQYVPLLRELGIEPVCKPAVELDALSNLDGFDGILVQKKLFRLPIDFVPFELQRQIEVPNTFSIGLLPLPDTPFSHGKSPIKALRYMAAAFHVRPPRVRAHSKCLESRAVRCLPQLISPGWNICSSWPATVSCARGWGGSIESDSKPCTPPKALRGGWPPLCIRPPNLHELNVRLMKPCGGHCHTSG